MSIVERIAEAMMKHMFAEHELPGALSNHWLVERYQDCARAVLAVMREPTNKMGAVGTSVMNAKFFPGDAGVTITDEMAESINLADRLAGNPARWAMPIWRAMIDEALKEEED